VLAWLIRDGELSQVVADHVWLNLNLSEVQAVVDTDDRCHHLREDDLVAHVRLDRLWLLQLWGILLCLSQSLQQLG